MTGRAAVKASNFPKIVIDREVWQPNLVNAQRTVEGVEHRQFEQRLANVWSPLLQRLGQEQQFLAVVGKLFGSRIFAAGHFLEA